MGHKTTDAEVQKVYDEFWRRIVEPDGVLDFEQVKKELFDYHTVIGEVTKVYGHITSNQFTKPTTTAEAVIDATEEHYKWWFSEDEQGEEKHLPPLTPQTRQQQTAAEGWNVAGDESLRRLEERIASGELKSLKYDPVFWAERQAEARRNLQPGQPCGPGCANHVTHPCERCGRYQAGLADGPPVPSEPWEVQDGWEQEIAKPVVFSNLAPREAKQILELVGECLSRSGYSVELILKAIKATPHLQPLIRIAERAEDAGDTDIECPFCGVVGDKNHLRDCLVTEARKVLVQVKAATQ